MRLLLLKKSSISSWKNYSENLIFVYLILCSKDCLFIFIHKFDMRHQNIISINFFRLKKQQQKMYTKQKKKIRNFILKGKKNKETKEGAIHKCFVRSIKKRAKWEWVRLATTNRCVYFIKKNGKIKQTNKSNK